MSQTASVKAAPRLTPEEYLAIERAGPTKSEYFDGRMFAMAGASRAHDTLVVNSSAELRVQLRGTGCQHYTSDVRVRISESGPYTYPDLVVRGEQRFADAELDTLLNPTLIIEVLSPSTKDWDRGGKFERYQQLPSLREYVLVAQDRPHVEQFLRQPDGRWDPSEVTGLDGVARLSPMGCTLRLADVCEGVTFRREEEHR